MARIHGIVGEWARVKGAILGLWPLGLGIFLSGFSLALLVAKRDMWSALFLGAALGLVGWSLHRGAIKVRRFYIGARGEEKVSSILKNLSDKYDVFNDFIARGVHVDHVVVGPPGVFAIETKYWKGAVTVEEGHILLDGQLPSRPPLKQVLKEAALVKAELAKIGWMGPVTPVLAFASDTFGAHIAEVQGAVIINSSELQKSFSTDKIIIAEPEKERLVSLMENIA